MIEKLITYPRPLPNNPMVVEDIGMDNKSLFDKINELVDAVNAIQKEREAERFEIQAWIGILEAVCKSVNVHEKQIDELQMKVEPAENAYTKTCRMDKEFAEEELDRTKKQLEAAKTPITEIKTVIAEQDLEPQELERKD